MGLNTTTGGAGGCGVELEHAENNWLYVDVDDLRYVVKGELMLGAGVGYYFKGNGSFILLSQSCNSLSSSAIIGFSSA